MTFLHSPDHSRQYFRPFHLPTEFIPALKIVRSPHIEEFAPSRLCYIRINYMSPLSRLIHAVECVAVPDAEKSSLTVIVVADQNFAILLESGLHQMMELRSREYLLESILALQTNVLFQDLHKQLCYLFSYNYAVFMRKLCSLNSHPVHISIILLGKVTNPARQIVSLLCQIG